ITATFSKPVQPGTIAFTLKDSANNSVAATVTYNASTNVATLTPSAALAASTTFTATVSGAQDTTGNTIIPVTWSFTTAAPDTTPPTITATAPAARSLHASLRTYITATFSKPVQPGTIAFTLKDSANNLVAATVTYNASTQ